LVCDAGFVPALQASMKCQEDTAAGKFDWNVPMSELQCVTACHLVVGGITNKTRFKHFP